METFRIKSYQIETDKITGNQELRFAVLADLHGIQHGEKNEALLKVIRDAHPDAVLVAGDMLVRSELHTLPVAEQLLSALVQEFPVFYSMGNHEYKMKFSQRGEAYEAYENRLSDRGVCFLHNETMCRTWKGIPCYLHGLELPLEYYKKPKSKKLTQTKMEALLGIPQGNGLHILLAHNPKYGNAYFSWGADLILSGHYHGGVLRFSEHYGLTCPQFLLFPPYCCGLFQKGNKYMAVSAGLGEHTIPVRIHNPRELLLLSLVRKQKEDGNGDSH